MNGSGSKNKIIISLILKALAAALFLTVLNRVLMPKYVSENQDGRITADFYKEELAPDVIFVGSSTVFSAVVPVILWERAGFTSYDRGNASQPMWTSYYMIEDALKSRNRPEMVVLDVGFIKYDDRFVEEPSNRKALDGMRLSLSKYRAVMAAKGSEERFIEYLFPVLRFHTRWKELSAEDWKYAFSEPSVDHNGYIIDFVKTETVPDRRPGEYAGKSRGETILSSRNKEYLIKILELCKRENVSLFLMKLPSLSDNWSTYYDEQIRKLAEPYGISYVNFDVLSDEMGIDYSTDSPDEGSHLNTYGAEKFSVYLADYLKANYDIASHRDDERYVRVWEEKSERYEKEKAAVLAGADKQTAP
ncbi:MAG TPA: hypothetical protein DCL38_06535 [Lachnospiraceae bacterium]|nr:hypothetical protein [Lachnospiraceae bacterium]